MSVPSTHHVSDTGSNNTACTKLVSPPPGMGPGWRKVIGSVMVLSLLSWSRTASRPSTCLRPSDDMSLGGGRTHFDHHRMTAGGDGGVPHTWNTRCSSLFRPRPCLRSGRQRGRPRAHVVVPTLHGWAPRQPDRRLPSQRLRASHPAQARPRQRAAIARPAGRAPYPRPRHPPPSSRTYERSRSSRSHRSTTDAPRIPRQGPGRLPMPHLRAGRRTGSSRARSEQTRRFAAAQPQC